MTDENGQGQLIPDEPLETEMRRIALSTIPPEETRGSVQPSLSMRQSVERFGVMVPILVSPATLDNSDDKYRLLAGRRRILAARSVGLMMVNAVVFPHGTSRRQAISLIENEQRADNLPVAVAQIEELLTQGATLDDVCDACGIDKRRAVRLVRLTRLIPELRDLLTNGRMAVGVAEQAARLDADEQQEVYRRVQARDGKVRGQDIDAMRRVRAANAAAALPASLFGSEDGGATVPQADEPDDGPPPLIGGLVVAIGANSLSTVQRSPRSITNLDDARDAVRALLAFLEPADGEPPLQGHNAERFTVSLQWFLNGGSEEGHHIGAKPASVARMERRKKAKERQRAEAAATRTT